MFAVPTGERNRRTCAGSAYQRAVGQVLRGAPGRLEDSEIQADLPTSPASSMAATDILEGPVRPPSTATRQ